MVFHREKPPPEGKHASSLPNLLIIRIVVRDSYRNRNRNRNRNRYRNRDSYRDRKDGIKDRTDSTHQLAATRST